MPAPAQQLVATGRPAIVAVSAFRALFVGTDSWFDATSVDINAGRVQAIYDQIDPSHTLAQASSSKQALTPTADAQLGGNLSMTFTASSAQTYKSSRAASAWTYMHDGTGHTAVVVWVPTTVTGVQYIVGTQDATTRAGWDYIRNNADVLHRVVNDSGGTTYSSTVTAQFAANVSTYGGGTFHAAASPAYTTRRKSATIGSGGTLSAPSITVPVPLWLGSRNDVGLWADMRFHALYCWHRVLNSTELGVVDAHIQSTTGIAP